MKPQLLKRCRDCMNRSKVEIDGFATCFKRHADVWLDSVACDEIDDVEPF